MAAAMSAPELRGSGTSFRRLGRRIAHHLRSTRHELEVMLDRGLDVETELPGRHRLEQEAEDATVTGGLDAARCSARALRRRW